MTLSVVGVFNAAPLNNPTTGDWDVSGIGFNAGDLCIFGWYCRDSTKTFTEPGTVIQKADFAGGVNIGRTFIGYRYLQAGDTTFTWTASSVATVSTLWGNTVIRGQLTSAGDPFAAITGPQTFANAVSPDPPAVTPPDNDSLIFTAFGKMNDYTGITAPTNYVLQENSFTALGTDGSYGTATRILSGGGGASEDPAVFTLTGGASTDDGVVWTGAISPAAAAAPTLPPLNRRDKLRHEHATTRGGYAALQAALMVKQFHDAMRQGARQ